MAGEFECCDGEDEVVGVGEESWIDDRGVFGVRGVYDHVASAEGGEETNCQSGEIVDAVV